MSSITFRHRGAVPELNSTGRIEGEIMNGISPADIVGAQAVGLRGTIALGVNLQALGLGHPSGFDLHGMRCEYFLQRLHIIFDHFLL